MTRTEEFAELKAEAVALVDTEPAAAITRLTWALHRVLGWDEIRIARSLLELAPMDGQEGLREWIRRLP